jgi:hypothetical protein
MKQESCSNGTKVLDEKVFIAKRDFSVGSDCSRPGRERMHATMEGCPW